MAGILAKEMAKLRRLCSSTTICFKAMVVLLIVLLVTLFAIKHSSNSGFPDNKIPSKAEEAGMDSNLQLSKMEEQTTDLSIPAVKDVTHKAKKSDSPGVSQAKMESKFKCFNSIAHEDFKDLVALNRPNFTCKLYRRGVITGDLCKPLCERGQIEIMDCANLKHTQKKVIQVSCVDACKRGRTVPAFLKTEKKDTKSALKELPPWQGPGNDAEDFLTESRDIILKYVNTHIGFDPFRNRDPLKVIWGQGSERDLQHVQYASAVWRSLSMLFRSQGRQSEYILGKALADYRIFPEMYGSCGHYYLEESCPPRPFDWTPPQLAHLHHREASWIGRAQDALNILQLIERLETALPSPMIACDVKLENLGFCSEGDLRVIDSTSYFFNVSTPRPSQPCSVTGSPCHIWQRRCPGTCDALRGVCVMRNSVNLEYTCRSIFMVRSNMTNPVTATDGRGELLRDPPPSVASDMHRALKDCSSLSQLLAHEPGAIQRLVEELRTLLHRSLLHPQY